MLENQRRRLPRASLLLDRLTVGRRGRAAGLRVVVNTTQSLRIKIQQQKQLTPQTFTRAAQRIETSGLLQQLAALGFRPVTIDRETNPGTEPGQEVEPRSIGLKRGCGKRIEQSPLLIHLAFHTAEDRVEH